MLEWTPEKASLLQDRPFSAASVYISREAEPPDIFQHQSIPTRYLRTRGQETFDETCVIHTKAAPNIYPVSHSLPRHFTQKCKNKHTRSSC